MICSHCGYDGELLGKSLKCPHCMNVNIDIKPKEHFRICYACFTVDKVSCFDKSRAVYCRSCSSKIRNTKLTKDLIRYRYTCECCGVERVLKAKSTAKFCKDCAFESTKKGNTHERICTQCGTSEMVRTKKAAKGLLCHKCQKKKRNEERYRGVGTKKKKRKVYSQVGTDGAKRNKVTVKFQVVDEKTMEAPVKKRKEREFPQLDRTVELDMQNEWMKNNSVKVC